MKYAWMLILCPCLAGCSIGPQVETRHIFVHNGAPATIMQDATLKVGTIDGGQAAISKQNVGGWKTMPDDHWDAVKSLIERLQKENAELKKK